MIRMKNYYKYCRKCKDLKKFVYDGVLKHSFCDSCKLQAGVYYMSECEYLSLLSKWKQKFSVTVVPHSDYILKLKKKISEQKIRLADLNKKIKREDGNK